MTPTWIAADWGTTNVRFWAMGADGTALDMRTSDQGMATLAPSGFETVLTTTCADWLTCANTVVACGMVGSRQGWVEAPYQTTPCAICPNDMVTAPVTHKNLTIHIIPGIRQMDPADVMRGEETQIAGFIAQNPDFDGVICLPGTHTKWAHISAREIISFQTLMTGELFFLLKDHSVLRHSIAPTDWNMDAFHDAMSQTLSRPETLAGRLFSIRAAQLVNNTDPIILRARLSGLLIGAELAATKPYWLGRDIALIGADAVSMPYIEGLKAQGAPVTRADATDMTLAGIKSAHALLKARP